MNGIRASYAALILSAIALAQTATTTTPMAPSPIKVTTRLVEMNVLVHDHHGNPVSDLKKEDFEVKDEGKVQTIILFTVDSVGTGSGAGNKPAVEPILPRNIVTNRPERQANVPSSVTVLLLDMYNTKLTDQMYAKQHLIKFLRQIRPEDRIALYVLNGTGFSVVHDFTNNSETLLAAIAKVFPGFSHELDGSDFDPSNTGDDNLDTLLDTSNTTMSNFYIRNRALNTCLAFKVLAEHLSGIPGRKNVVWVSGGFPISFGFGDPRDLADSQDISKVAAQDRELFASYIEDASTAMNNANVAVYPVDARGLMGLPMADASKSVKLNPQTHQIPSSLTHVDQKNIDTMNYISDLTGGKAFYNTNDLQGAIRKAIDDSAVTYTLGYYVSGDSWDNRFHKIKVKVDRSGLVVRTKKGYLAKEQPAPTPGKLDQTLHEAVWSPLDATTIGVSARIDPSPALTNASRLYFAVDPNEIQFKPENDRYAGSLDIVFVQQTKRGKLIANTKKTLNLTVTPVQLDLLKKQGLRAGEDLKLNSDTQAVRIVILDRESGSTGSVTVPVTAQDKSGSTLPEATLPAGTAQPASVK